MFGLFKNKEQKALELLQKVAASQPPPTGEQASFMVGVTPTGNIQLKVGGSSMVMDAQTAAFLISQLATCIQNKYQVEIKQIIEESKND
jgi:hypothetical protein